MSTINSAAWAARGADLSSADLRERYRLLDGLPAEFDPWMLYGYRCIAGRLVLLPLRPRRSFTR